MNAVEIEAAITDLAAHPCDRAGFPYAFLLATTANKLVDINRTKLDNLLHRIFAPAQINITIQDRFGNPVQPKEWFLVPLAVIDEAVQRIRDGSITGVDYDPKTARLVPR